MNTYENLVVLLNAINPDISLALNTRFDKLINEAKLQTPYSEIVNIVVEIKSQVSDYGFIASSITTPLAPTIVFASSFCNNIQRRFRSLNNPRRDNNIFRSF